MLNSTSVVLATFKDATKTGYQGNYTAVGYILKKFVKHPDENGIDSILQAHYLRSIYK